MSDKEYQELLEDSQAEILQGDSKVRKLAETMRMNDCSDNQIRFMLSDKAIARKNHS
jgi:hypothetical protein